MKRKTLLSENRRRMHSGPKPRVIVIVGLVLLLITTGTILARRGNSSGSTRQKTSQPQTEVASPASLTPGSPSKEYVYAGGRLVATEEPQDINGKVAFSSNRTGSNQIFTINSDGTGTAAQLTNTGDNTCPTWSPDGTKIAFIRSNDVWRMDANASNQTNLTQNGSASSYPPSWSANGAKVLYRASGIGFRLMNADGTNQQSIPNISKWNEQPALSPDGTKIAFREYVCCAGTPALFVINVGGTGKTPILSANSAENPWWSPDGTKIAFDSRRDSPTNTDIYVMNANGSNVVRITSQAGTDWQPRWSPDGLRLTYISDEGVSENNHVFVMDAIANAPRTKITNIAAANDERPSWGHK